MGFAKKLVFATEFGNSLDKIRIWNMTGSEIHFPKSRMFFFSLLRMDLKTNFEIFARFPNKICVLKIGSFSCRT